jgi:tetratricopeptide (TPR) repeat protein
MAVFGIPRVREDDALRAVRAAAEIRERLPAVAAEAGVALRFRTGVNTGSVLMGEGENLAIGDAVNVAARLEQAAAPGEIVIGEETLRLVRDAVHVEQLEPLQLKGKSEPVPAFRVLGVDPAAEGFARHLDAPLVGRQGELRLLRESWDRVVRESGCHLLTLLGTAGVGKSRLVAELLSTVGDQAMVLRGRCLHYGEGITFWPMVEALMPVGEPAQRVLDDLTTGSAAIAEELFWEVRRLLEALAGSRPVLFHVDDLQWAQPTLLDLLDHVVDLSRGSPILLLCTARPELLEERPGWGGGKLNATTLLLEPLGAADSEALLDELGDSLDPEARRRVIAASEGNPLFLEEMVALAQERGTVEVPPTIQALLAARLERLGVEERALLEVNPELARRAAEHLYAAGERAADRRDMSAARNLLERALVLTDPEDSRIALALADALVTAGESARVEELLLAAEADPGVAPVATLVRLDWLASTRTGEFFEEVGTLLPGAIGELQRRGDARGLAKAHWVAHLPHNMACQAAAMAAELRQAADYAAAAGDSGMRTQALGRYLNALWFGRTPIAEIIAELDAIESEQPGPYLAAWLDRGRATVYGLEGQFEDSRILERAACDGMESLGQRAMTGAIMIEWANIELSADNPDGARDVLQEADQILAEVGETAFRSTVQSELAQAYARLGEREAALAAIELSGTLGVKEDIVNFVLTHLARAQLARDAGDLAEAERWARSALQYAEHTDYVTFALGDSNLELARVLAASGRRDEAAAHAQHALAMLEAKGDQPRAARARKILGTLE